MIVDRPRIGIVSLGEAGNLGDDLILMAVVDAIYARWPYADVRFLSFGQELDWAEIARRRGYVSSPHRVRDVPELPLVRENRRHFADRDVIIFGGGGLLQTSHSPDRPYEWLSYLPTPRSGPRVVAVGLGLGPLTPKWKVQLARLGTPFDAAWVRDPDSLKLATDELHWPAHECRDFIDQEFLTSVIGDAVGKSAEGPATLGVALRAWPGLDVADVADHIRAVASDRGCDSVEFFVLEANHGRGVDVDFTRSVARRSALPHNISIYEGTGLVEFIRRMRGSEAAISMKLHSSAIWAAGGVPLYPIYYAPKISAFFGVQYQGLEISRQVIAPAPEPSRVPRAASALVAGIEAALLTTGSGSRFSFVQRVRFQTRRIWRAISRRLGVERKATK